MTEGEAMEFLREMASRTAALELVLGVTLSILAAVLIMAGMEEKPITGAVFAAGFFLYMILVMP